MGRKRNDHCYFFLSLYTLCSEVEEIMDVIKYLEMKSKNNPKDIAREKKEERKNILKKRKKKKGAHTHTHMYILRNFFCKARHF